MQSPPHLVVRSAVVALMPVVDSGPERLYTTGSERVRVTDDTVEHAPSFTSRIVGTARCGDGWLFESEEGTVAYASSFTGELHRVIDVPPAGGFSPDPLLSSTPIAEAAPYAWRLTEGRVTWIECGGGAPTATTIALPAADGVLHAAFAAGGAGLVMLRGGLVLVRSGAQAEWRTVDLGGRTLSPLSAPRPEGATFVAWTQSGGVEIDPDGTVRDVRSGPGRAAEREAPRADVMRALAALPDEQVVRLEDGSVLRRRGDHLSVERGARRSEGRWSRSSPTDCELHTWAGGSIVCSDAIHRVFVDGERVRTARVESIGSRWGVHLIDQGPWLFVAGSLGEVRETCDGSSACFRRADRGLVVPVTMEDELEGAHELEGARIVGHGARIVVGVGAGWRSVSVEEPYLTALTGPLAEATALSFARDGTLWGTREEFRSGAYVVAWLRVGAEGHEVPLPGQVRRAWVFDRNTMLAVGDSLAEVWSTIDGGRRWEPLPLPSDVDADPSLIAIGTSDFACDSVQCRLGDVLAVSTIDAPPASAVLGPRTPAPVADAAAEQPAPRSFTCRHSDTPRQEGPEFDWQGRGARIEYRWRGIDARGAYRGRASGDATPLLCEPAGHDRRQVVMQCCGASVGTPCDVRHAGRRGVAVLSEGGDTTYRRLRALAVPSGGWALTFPFGLGRSMLLELAPDGAVRGRRELNGVADVAPGYLDGRVVAYDTAARDPVAMSIDPAQPSRALPRVRFDAPACDREAGSDRIFAIPTTRFYARAGAIASQVVAVVWEAGDGAGCLREVHTEDFGVLHAFAPGWRGAASRVEGPDQARRSTILDCTR